MRKLLNLSVTAVLCVFFLTSCDRAREVPAAAEKLNIVSIPITDIGPGKSENLNAWEGVAQAALIKYGGYECATKDNLHVQISSEADAQKIYSSMQIGGGPIIKSIASADLKKLCDDAANFDPGVDYGIRIYASSEDVSNALNKHFSSHIDLFLRQTFILPIHPGYPGLLKLSYPKSYRYSKDDFELIAKGMKERFGSKCCEIVSLSTADDK